MRNLDNNNNNNNIKHWNRITLIKKYKQWNRLIVTITITIINNEIYKPLSEVCQWCEPQESSLLSLRSLCNDQPSREWQ